MKKNFAFLLLSIVCCPPSTATELPARSLFFPSGAAPAISQTTAPMPQANTGNNINNFLYVSPVQWSFWWRGQRITPDTLPPTIRIESISLTQLIFTENGQKHGFEVGKFDSAGVLDYSQNQ